MTKRQKRIGVSNAELADRGMIEEFPDDVVDLVTFTPRQEELLLRRDSRPAHVSREVKLRDAKRRVLENRKEEADSLKDQLVADLRHRLGQLEQLLGPGGKSLAKVFIEGCVASTKKYVKEQGEVLMEAMGEALGERAAELDKRMDALEARPVMVFKGIWDVLTEYERGHVVTHDSALWTCLEPCKGGRPGKTPDWRLIAKSGAGGRNHE
jgi:hypothetical protein